MKYSCCPKELRERIRKARDTKLDLHVIRYYSSFVMVSQGAVVGVTNPVLKYCPLAHFLYADLRDGGGEDISKVKDAIRRLVEEKISKYGFFTQKRQLREEGLSIPFGASEILMYGLRRTVIDCTVVVCDGAGTVITASSEIVQGVGARMNSVLVTTAIPEVIGRLSGHGCHVISEDGTIDQEEGVLEAAKRGYKKIAVTVNGYHGEALGPIRAIEERLGVSVFILVVCTTGIEEDRIREIREYADMVWACNSDDIKTKIGRIALKQLSKISPVYILTNKGSTLMAGYSPNIYGIRQSILSAGT